MRRNGQPKYPQGHPDTNVPTPPCCTCGQPITEHPGPFRVDDGQTGHAYHYLCLLQNMGLIPLSIIGIPEDAINKKLLEHFKRGTPIELRINLAEWYHILALMQFALLQPVLPELARKKGLALGRIIQMSLIVATKSALVAAATESGWHLKLEDHENYQEKPDGPK